MSKQREIVELLEKVADIKEFPVETKVDTYQAWVSKIDGSYICQKGFEEPIKFLLTYGITEKIQSALPGKETANIGFNPEDEMWYGWSHRAIGGFGVGDSVEMGDVGFVPKNKQQWQRATFNFWTDDEPYFEWSKMYKDVSELGEAGILIVSKYNNEAPNKNLHGTELRRFIPYPDSYDGRGEWTAQTLEDAKQMAIDFARGIS